MRRDLIAALAVALLIPAAVRADDVTLNNGTVHKDLTLTKETDKLLEFLTLDGKKLSFSKDSIANHERKPTARDEYKTRKAEITPKDFVKLLELASWAKEKGLVRESRQELEAILKLDPANAGAHEALGHKQVGGKWLSESESKKAEAAAAEAEAKARGLKKWKDRWVSPLDYYRLEKDMAEVEGVWVFPDLKKRIDAEKLTYLEGEWVTPKDRERMDAGERQYKGKWMKIEELNDLHRSLEDPWVLKSPIIEIRSNSNHDSVKKYLAIAEDGYASLKVLFGGDHPDVHDGKGQLLIVVARNIDGYQTLGKAFAAQDRLALHSSGFGAFFSASLRVKDAKGKDIERGGGITYHQDWDYNRIYITHAVAHAYLDRLLPELESDAETVEAIAGYLAGCHKGKYAPTWDYYSRFLNNAANAIGTGATLLDRVNYKSDHSLAQAGLFLHFLHQKRPEAFVGVVGNYASATRNQQDDKLPVKKCSLAPLLTKACLGKDLDKEADAINAEFAAFVAAYKKGFVPWDK